MKRRILVGTALAVIMTLALGSTAFAWTFPWNKPRPPGQPPSGFGSRAGYICSSYQKLQSGSILDGTLVTCYVPSRLKNGGTAPVVVFLHGFLMVAPEIYRGLIEHMAYQGYIVVCPEANVGNPLKLVSDMDQNVMMKRAVDNAAKGFKMVAGRAEMNNLLVCGHSLGGLLGACWMASGGPRPKALVLMNPSTDAGAGMPSFVNGLVKITSIDWKARARAVDVPVMILTGDQDTIAPLPQALELHAAMTRAPSRVVYCLQGDSLGRPELKADHNASMCDDGLVPTFLMNFAGGGAEVDATDYRYYWAALDAALSGRTSLAFDTGRWSNGTPVKQVRTLAQ